MTEVNPEGFEARGNVGRPKRPKRNNAFTAEVIRKSIPTSTQGEGVLLLQKGHIKEVWNNHSSGFMDSFKKYTYKVSTLPARGPW